MTVFWPSLGNVDSMDTFTIYACSFPIVYSKRGLLTQCIALVRTRKLTLLVNCGVQ